jgi:hypothetical protein
LEHGGIELLVGEVEPSAGFVVEVCQGTFLEFSLTIFGIVRFRRNSGQDFRDRCWHEEGFSPQ